MVLIIPSLPAFFGPNPDVNWNITKNLINKNCKISLFFFRSISLSSQNSIF